MSIEHHNLHLRIWTSLRTTVLTIMVLLYSAKVYSQQTAQHTLYMFNQYQYNPAYGGLDYSLSGSVHVRNQWQGLEQGPSSVLVNCHLPFYVWNGALGVQISSRDLGVFHYREATASYNYVLDLGNALWSNGARVGLSQLGIDGTAIITPDGVYTGGSVNHNDPLLPNSSIAGSGLSWQIGTYYKSDRLEMGGTLQGLPGNNIGVGSVTFNRSLHVTAFGQYRFQIFGEYEVLQSILLKSDLVNIQTDITSIMKINGNVFGGIGLRGYSSSSLDAVSVILGAQLSKHITLIYSYDAGISGLRTVNDGSHELLINYNLQKAIGTGLPPKIIYNPRYL